MFDIEIWLQNLLKTNPVANTGLIRNALNLAQLTGSEYSNPYGVSCFQQGLEMAEILNDIQVDSETIAAAIIYSCVQYADLSLEDLAENFGSKIEKLIVFTKQMDDIAELYKAVSHRETKLQKVDNIRKMLLAMIDDVRAVLIKLAEQLCNLRHVKILNEEKKQQIAQETMAIYAPLANRLGISNIKWELEDLAFRYLNPQKYKEISHDLNERRIEREQYVEKMISTLTDLLKKAGIENMQVTGRAKHIYSIYKKMQRKHVGLSGIYDTTALRVMVPTIEDCYKVLSCAHTNWASIPSEFDDYIATPKPNGYKSIHTAIIDANNKYVEIQIRTFDMHQHAELGVAAHWLYKEKPQKSADYEAKIAWLRQVMAWQKEITNTEDTVHEVQNIFDDHVYVFTPNNDILELQKGATVLDFAYNIHSEVGHRCRGAKVDNNIVNLTYQLKTGDSVEILTSKQPNPSRDWLNPHLGFLKTSRAKAKVHGWFKNLDYEKNITSGEEILDREFKRLGFKNINIGKIATNFNFKNNDELFAALGCGDLKISSIINSITQESKAPEPLPTAAAPSITKKATTIEIQGVDNLLTHIANCCQPIPGDAIIGYITQGRGISIHRQDCSNMKSTYKTKPERLLEVTWGTEAYNNYPINLIIEAYDRHALIKDISNTIANENITLIGLTANVNKKNSIAYINLTIEVKDLKSLERIITKLNQLPDMTLIKRSA